VVSTVVYLNGEQRAGAHLNASECLSEEYVRKPALCQGPLSIHALLGGLLMAPSEANHNPSHWSRSTVMGKSELGLTSTHEHVSVRNSFKGQLHARPTRYPRTLGQRGIRSKASFAPCPLRIHTLIDSEECV
jgi:hypothetical protein